MSRALAFKAKLETYGSTIVLKSLATEKCTCWQYGYPNKDHTPCGGTGYLNAGEDETVKAFIFPTSDSQKEYVADVGVAKAGSCKVYLSPDVDLYVYKEMVWDSVTYRIADRDRVTIVDEIIYKSFTAERIS
jgi:hypothetical protein